MRQYDMLGIATAIWLTLNFTALPAALAGTQTDDPCEGCTSTGADFYELEDQECNSDLVSCSNLQCSLFEYCMYSRAFPVKVKVTNLMGDPECLCGTIQRWRPCGESGLGVYPVDVAVFVPPCTRVYIFITLNKRAVVQEYRINCSQPPAERIITDIIEVCPVSHTVRILSQSESGCCPSWIPVLPTESVP